MIAVGSLGGPLVIRDRLIPQGDGTVTVSNLDGTVMSVNPSGGEESRPTGTAGPWEKATKTGNVLVFWTGNPAFAAYPFELGEVLPNT